jgi:hypothetical protein
MSASRSRATELYVGVPANAVMAQKLSLKLGATCGKVDGFTFKPISFPHLWPLTDAESLVGTSSSSTVEGDAVYVLRGDLIVNIPSLGIEGFSAAPDVLSLIEAAVARVGAQT